MILVKESRVGGLTLPDFKAYSKAAVMKRLWYYHRINIKINETEQSLQIYGQLTKKIF